MRIVDMFFAMGWTDRNAPASNLRVGGFVKHHEAMRVLKRSKMDGFIQDDKRQIVTAVLKGETLFQYEENDAKSKSNPNIRKERY